MLAMENPSRYGRTSNSNSFRQRRSGYEPSDTETEWQPESPWHDLKNNMPPRDACLVVPDRAKTPTRNVSPLGRSRRYPSLNHDYTTPVKTTPPTRRNSSKSPYKPRRLPDTSEDNHTVSPNMDGSDVKRNISPFTNSQRSRRHVSPYKPTRGEEPKVSQKNTDAESALQEVSKVSERSNYSHRSKSAPKPRPKEIDRKPPSPLSIVAPKPKLVEDKKISPLPRSLVKNVRETHHVRAPSAGEINEMAGMAKLANITTNGDYQDDIGSSSPGNIFFSREYAGFAAQKNANPRNKFSRPDVIPEKETNSQQRIRVIQKTPPPKNTDIVPYKPHMSRTNSSSNLSRQSTSKSGTESSRFTDGSLRSSESLRKFTANRQKVHKETWFGCIKKGPCRLSKSPERRDIDEASFIGKAFVVENLRQFWAEKHRPSSLNGFTCHKHQAQLLKQLTSRGSCPHILFKGPSGSGKKSLTMALLHEIYSEPAWDINHELRRFHSQENRSMEVVVPITSSPHHVELSLKKEAKNARYALMTLVKEMTRNPITPDISTISFRADYKVIVLYEVDKAAENIQHLIKWIMDCYTDSCKLVLCCEDDVDVLDSVKNRCEVIKVDAPVTHEIMEVLIQIARKENFDLPMSFAAKIATKSKQNLRKAIMAMEACKAHNYPFSDEQPIPFGWEEVLVELAAEILADPSPKRLFYTRGKFQKLLVDFVHPKLILQKLVEQFLMGVEASLKRELYYWHSYYDKRLPVGTSALLKLEEFVAKFMSIYRKSFRVHLNP